MYTITIANTGDSYRCGPARNLLAGMEALGRNGIPVGCRGGGCGVCKVRVDAGQVRSETMSRVCISAGEAERGFVLACRSYAASDVTVIAVDRLARCVVRSLERHTVASFLARATSASTNPPSQGDTSWQ
jgi:ferredoxin